MIKNSDQYSREIHYRPIRWWAPINWQEFLWYKDFLLLLTWRHISSRYRQTVIGIAWVVLQPTINLVVFTLIFNRMAGVKSSHELPYPIFLMAGLLFWQYFSSAINFTSNALIDTPELVNRVYVPRYMLTLSIILAAGIDFVIGLALLIIMLIAWGITVPAALLFLMPILFIIMMFFVLGLGLILSSINAQFRDIRFVVPFFTQVFFFLTPIFYPLEILTNHPLIKQTLTIANPLAGLITLARSTIAGMDFDAGLLGISFSVSTAVLLLGWVFFRKREAILADII